METATTSAAMVPAETVTIVSAREFRQELEPHDGDEILRRAAIYAKIQMCKVKSPEEAFIRMITGRELGLTHMAAMRGIYVVDGNPSISAAMKQALVQASPLCEKFELLSSDHTHAEYLVKRKGAPEKRFRFDVDDAKRAGLLEKDNWKKHPRRMFQARAKGEACDVLFPEVLLGIATLEDMQDEERPATQRVEVTRVTQVDAAPRNLDLEFEALKAQILSASTPELKKAARDAVKAFADDVGEPWAQRAKDAWNAAHAPPKPADPPAPAPEAKP